MSGDIDVVVVSHASEESLDACLARLRAATGVASIRVVDNASHDSSLDIIQVHALADARVRFIANPDNPGFAVACNQGAAAGNAPWLAFVNPDCLLEADALQRLREHARAFDAALVGADLHDEDGRFDPASRRRAPRFVRMLRSRAARRLAIPRDPGTALQPVDAVSGALMLMPRALFARMGGFDEAYRLHAEDLDLCRRAHAAGATIACANDVPVLHLRGVSSRSRPLFVEWHKHRGLWRYFLKFDAQPRALAINVAVFAMIWGRFPLALWRALRRRGKR